MFFIPEPLKPHLRLHWLDNFGWYRFGFESRLGLIQRFLVVARIGFLASPPWGHPPNRARRLFKTSHSHPCRSWPLYLETLYALPGIQALLSLPFSTMMLFLRHWETYSCPWPKSKRVDHFMKEGHKQFPGTYSTISTVVCTLTFNLILRTLQISQLVKWA